MLNKLLTFEGQFSAADETTSRLKWQNDGEIHCAQSSNVTTDDSLFQQRAASTRTTLAGIIQQLNQTLVDVTGALSGLQTSDSSSPQAIQVEWLCATFN